MFTLCTVVFLSVKSYYARNKQSLYLNKNTFMLKNATHHLRLQRVGLFLLVDGLVADWLPTGRGGAASIHSPLSLSLLCVMLDSLSSTGELLSKLEPVPSDTAAAAWSAMFVERSRSPLSFHPSLLQPRQQQIPSQKPFSLLNCKMSTLSSVKDLS